jgi:hypothetical protein
LASARAAATRSAADLDGLGLLAGLSHRGREQRRCLHDRLEGDKSRATDARDRYEDVAARVAQLRQEQGARDRFETAEGWRRDDLVRLREQLDHHWAEVVVACLRADDPLVYGIGKLRLARTIVDADRRVIDAGIPDDRTDEWQEARSQLAGVVKQRHQVEELVAAGQARLEEAGRRRWGRRDHEAVADAQAQLAAGERQVRQAVGTERELRERVGALAEHQLQRRWHIAHISAQRKELDATLAQVDAALDRTRPDRVAAFADDPPDYLVAPIGPVPDTRAGRAGWCHDALDIEAAVDRNEGRIPAWSGWSQQTDRASHEIAVADRVLEASSDRADPIEWQLARQAGIVLEQVRRIERNPAAKQRTRSQWQHPQTCLDPAAERPQPGISM